MDKVARGELDDEIAAAPKEGAPAEPVQPAVVEDGGVEPPPADFILDVHNVSALDMYVVFFSSLVG